MLQTSLDNLLKQTDEFLKIVDVALIDRPSH